jgi:hypothetical protein
MHTTAHDRIYFCSTMCKDDWTRVNALLIHAAEGKLVYQRRPTRPRHWYEKDG